jgi:hypothetical protein
MKVLLLSLLLLFTVAPLYAQKDSLKVVSHWKKNDIRAYEVSKITTQKDDTGAMRSDTESYSFRFVVMNITADGYRIKWDFDDSPILDELNEDEYEELSSKFGGLEMIYTTDRQGAFKHIENWQDISRYFTIFYNSRLADDPQKDNPRVANAYKQMMADIATQDGVENIVFNEMRFFHLPYGYSLPMKDTLRSDGQMQVGPADDYATSHIKYFLSDVDPQTGGAVLNKTTQIDTAEARKKLKIIMQANIDTMPVTTDKERQEKDAATKALPMLNFDSNEQYTFNFNYKTGFPSKVYFKQVTNVDLKVTRTEETREILIVEQKIKAGQP